MLIEQPQEIQRRSSGRELPALEFTKIESRVGPIIIWSEHNDVDLVVPMVSELLQCSGIPVLLEKTQCAGKPETKTRSQLLCDVRPRQETKIERRMARAELKILIPKNLFPRLSDILLHRHQATRSGYFFFFST